VWLARLLGSLDHIDRQGRPLGEQASRHHLGDDVVACPYPGDRRGRPMHRAALRQVAPHLDAVRAELSARSSGTVAGACAAVAHVCLRAELATEPVPVAWAAAYKATVGFRQVLGALLLAHDLRGVPLVELGDGEAFVELLQREGWLHGRRHVCAGSVPQIRDLYRALAQPDGRSEASLGAAEATVGVLAWLLERRQREPLPEHPLCRLANHRPGLAAGDAPRLMDAPSMRLQTLCSGGVPVEAVEALLSEAANSMRVDANDEGRERVSDDGQG
jgi:hypothetical protein